MTVDSNIGALPAAANIEDDSLLVAEQQGEAKHITGKMLKDYTKEGVQQFSSEAQSAAKDAQQAKKDAELARDQAQAIAGVDFLERPVYDPQNRKQDIFAYVDGKEFIGQRGTGENAEIFNNPDNVASGESSHAEGHYTAAEGNYSHAEGSGTTASGPNSHAEGYHSEATDSNSHAEGYFTNASGSAQHVQGRFNDIDTEGKYAHIVGNGTGTSGAKRSNAHTIDWAGLGWFAGGLKVGGTGQDDPEAKEAIAVPPVTAEDNGKVPRVVDGAWKAVDGGITIKKIVFTDRPSLWAWMLENVRKVISAELFQNGMSAGSFKATPWYTDSDIMVSIEFSSVTTEIQNLSVNLSMSTVQVTERNTMLDLLRRYELGDTITKVSEIGMQELPDMYWEYTGVEVTVYYYSE